MSLTLERATTSQVLALRERHMAATECQFVGWSLLKRGAGDPWVFRESGEDAGFVVVLNKYDPGHIQELYLERTYDVDVVKLLSDIPGATHVRVQTNMPLMLQMAFDLSDELKAEAVLFEDTLSYRIPAPLSGLSLVPVDGTQGVAGSQDFHLLQNGVKVGWGGYLAHYNPPFVDVWMEVAPEWRGKGLGSFLVQEIRRAANRAGKTPGARCSVDNPASRASLTKGGFQVCGHLVFGPIRGKAE